MHLLKRYHILDYPRLAPLWIAVFVDILGFSILIPFLPFYGQEYGAEPWLIGVLMSTNALFSFFSGPIWGTLSDRYGRRPMLLLSQLGTLAGFLMLAFSNNLVMLFLSRIVDGVFGGNFPIAKAIIGDVVPPEKRSVQMSNIGVAHVLSSLLGPGLGGWLSRWGIMAPGLFAASLTCITLAMTIMFLRESNPAVAGQSRAARRAAPARTVQRREVWRNPVARYLLIQWGFHTLSFSVYMSSVALFANLKLGLDAPQVGSMLMIAGVVRVFIRFVIFIPLRQRIGDRRTSLLGLSIYVVVFVLLGWVRTPAQFVGILCAVSFAAACTRGILTGFLSRSVRPWEQGQAMGLSASLDSLAQIIGPLAGGYLLGAQPLWTYGALAAACAAVALAMAFRQIEFDQERQDQGVAVPTGERA
ncbi:MAG: MFS transporter [Anaerolineae bacterium]|nr:MFS transporter [Anaerolineae bacterium]